MIFFTTTIIIVIIILFFYKHTDNIYFIINIEGKSDYPLPPPLPLDRFWFTVNICENSVRLTPLLVPLLLCSWRFRNVRT